MRNSRGRRRAQAWHGAKGGGGGGGGLRSRWVGGCEEEGVKRRAHSEDGATSGDVVFGGADCAPQLRRVGRREGEVAIGEGGGGGGGVRAGEPQEHGVGGREGGEGGELGGGAVEGGPADEEGDVGGLCSAEPACAEHGLQGAPVYV